MDSHQITGTWHPEYSRYLSSLLPSNAHSLFPHEGREIFPHLATCCLYRLFTPFPAYRQPSQGLSPSPVWPRSLFVLKSPTSWISS